MRENRDAKGRSLRHTGAGRWFTVDRSSASRTGSEVRGANLRATPFDVVLHPEIYDVHPRVVGALGGSLIRVRGTGFSSFKDSNKIMLGPQGDIPCKIERMNATELYCRVPTFRKITSTADGDVVTLGAEGIGSGSAANQTTGNNIDSFSLAEAGYGWSPDWQYGAAYKTSGPEAALRMPRIAPGSTVDIIHDLTERNVISAGVGPLRVGSNTCRAANLEKFPGTLTTVVHPPRVGISAEQRCYHSP